MVDLAAKKKGIRIDLEENLKRIRRALWTPINPPKNGPSTS